MSSPPKYIYFTANKLGEKLNEKDIKAIDFKRNRKSIKIRV